MSSPGDYSTTSDEEYEHERRPCSPLIIVLLVVALVLVGGGITLGVIICSRRSTGESGPAPGTGPSQPSGTPGPVPGGGNGGKNPWTGHGDEFQHWKDETYPFLQEKGWGEEDIARLLQEADTGVAYKLRYEELENYPFVSAMGGH